MGRVQIAYASSTALRSGAGFPDPVSLTVCPYPSCDLPTSPTARRISPPFQAAAGARYLSFFVISAQTMRAILLANATAMSILGLRASILASQGSEVTPRRDACRTTAIAPVISRRLRSRWPIFGYLAQPRLAAGAVLARHQAEPSGEVAAAPEALHRRCESLQRHRGDRTNPRNRHQSRRFFVPAGANMELLLQTTDLSTEFHDPIKQEPAQFANLIRPMPNPDPPVPMPAS